MEANVQVRCTWLLLRREKHSAQGEERSSRHCKMRGFVIFSYKLPLGCRQTEGASSVIGVVRLACRDL